MTLVAIFPYAWSVRRLLFALLVPAHLAAQSTKISLINPSFEGRPGASSVPKGWISGGFENESPPDIQPGQFDCALQPLHGNTYLGLVTRDNETWERIGQRLREPLRKDSLYDFSLCLAVSRYYISMSRMSGDPTNFTGPVRLRIWGINLEKNAAEILAETPEVSTHEWKQYAFEIMPRGFDAEMVLLEACYGRDKPTNGNLLLDNCSPFVLRTALPDTTRSRPRGEIFYPDRFDLYNASFDLLPSSDVPIGWEILTDSMITPVRTHPTKVQFVFEPDLNGNKVAVFRPYVPTTFKAYEGRMYAGLIATREKTTQALSQRLEGWLQRDSSYAFSLYMARSPRFTEKEPAASGFSNYKNPLKLRIWAGTSDNPKAELLAESGSVFETEWKKFDFTLRPVQGDYNWFTLEAWYVSETGKRYDGNVLLDGCSALVKIPN